MLGFLIKLLFFVLIGRLILSALRFLGLAMRNRSSRPAPPTKKPGEQQKRILGDDIVDADFEDVSKDSGR